MKHPMPNLSVPRGPPLGIDRRLRPAPVSDRSALLGSSLSSLLGRWLETLIGSTAVPDASTMLEIASWRADFPELAQIERELGRGSFEGEVAATPFGMLGVHRSAKLIRNTRRKRRHG